MTAYPISSPVQTSIWPSTTHTSNNLQKCSTRKAEMKEKPSSPNKKKINFKGNLAMSILRGMDRNGMIEV